MPVKDAKLLAILHAKSPFAESDIASMTDAEGWAWVYRNRPTRRDRSGEICFTGFTATECEALHAQAKSTGWLKPVGAVTARLAFLCTGAKPGPAKVAQAGQVGAEVIDVAAFERLISDGELPTAG